jgi:hypothetical protein
LGYLARALCCPKSARAHRDRRGQIFVLIFLEEKSEQSLTLMDLISSESWAKNV